MKRKPLSEAEWATMMTLWRSTEPLHVDDLRQAGANSGAKTLMARCVQKGYAKREFKVVERDFRPGLTANFRMAFFRPVHPNEGLESPAEDEPPLPPGFDRVAFAAEAERLRLRLDNDPALLRWMAHQLSAQLD